MALPVGTQQSFDGFVVPSTTMAVKDIQAASNAVVSNVALVTQNLMNTSFASSLAFYALIFLVQQILTWVVFFNVNSTSQINTTGIVNTSVANLVFAVLLSLVFLGFAVTVPYAWRSAQAPQMLFMMIAVLALLQSVFVAATTNGLTAGQANKSSTRGWNLAAFVTAIIEICLLGYMLWYQWPFAMDLVKTFPRTIQGITAGVIAL